MSSDALTTPVQHRSLGAVVADYVSLTKPLIIVWLEITTIAAMIMAQRGMPPLTLVGATVLGGWLAAAASNVINCWYDRDIDSTMQRTRHRPLVAGTISPTHAFIFGMVLLVLANLVFLVSVNLLSALLADSAFLIYVFIYTMWLKRSSPNNIVLGGAAGAIPPLVGWAAVQGHIGPAAVACFAIVFYWTPPHFWALALLLDRDYSSVQVPMLPVVRGRSLTRLHIVFYTVILSAITMLPFVMRSFGWIYFWSALVLDGVFFGLALKCTISGKRSDARLLFFYSLAYLALLFLAMSIDRVIHI
ncbi:MAG: heme o synthase [Candidatus Dormibacteria bacterium]